MINPASFFLYQIKAPPGRYPGKNNQQHNKYSFHALTRIFVR